MKNTFPDFTLRIQSPGALKQIRKIKQDRFEVMVIDLSDCTENQMMKLITESRKMLIKEARPQRLLAIFNNKNYITSKVLKHFETDQIEALKYSVKQAAVGMTMTQKLIVKGFNTISNRNIKVFETQEEALKYLLSE